MGRHTGSRLADAIFNIITDFEISEKLFCITTDNASNNIKCMKKLSDKLLEKGVIWSAKEHHIPCLNHVINLAVQAFLKKLKALNSENIQEDKEKEDKEKNYISEEEDEDESDDEIVMQDLEDELNIDSKVIDDFQSTIKKLRSIAKV